MFKQWGQQRITANTAKTMTINYDFIISVLSTQIKATAGSAEGRERKGGL